MVGHTLEVRLDLAPADHRAGRVVGVAEVDDLRARPDLAEDRVDVVAVFGQGNPLGDRAELERVEHVARKRRPAADDLVPRIEYREREVHDHGVGPRGDRDVLEGDGVPLGEG